MDLQNSVTSVSFNCFGGRLLVTVQHYYEEEFNNLAQSVIYMYIYYVVTLSSYIQFLHHKDAGREAEFNSTMSQVLVNKTVATAVTSPVAVKPPSAVCIYVSMGHENGSPYLSEQFTLFTASTCRLSGFEALFYVRCLAFVYSVIALEYDNALTLHLLLCFTLFSALSPPSFQCCFSD